MNNSPVQAKYHAVSMQLATYLDGRYVEMLILTDTGRTISITCDKDSIFAIQQHIEKLGKDCPEIATWTAVTNGQRRGESDQSSYDAAISEGWPVSPHGDDIAGAPGPREEIR